MGLNVYFCDVCGVRVTDVDLRSGHGMLRGHDVICATCLDMGHGKEWLATRGVPEAAAGASANGSALRPPSNAAVLDHARDRAATVEDEEEATQVPSAIDHEDTHSVRVQEADFAGAAAGFAALSAPEPVPVDDADGALDEESSDHVDPALLKPATDAVRATDEQPSVAIEAESEDDSSALISVKERAAAAKARGRSDRLRRSVSGARASAPTGKAPGKKSSASSVQSPKSSGSGKISKPKSSTTRSGRKASGGGGLPMPLKISLITVPLLLIIVAALLFSRGGGPRPEADVKDMPAQKAQIEKSYKEATTAINAAVSSKSLPVLKAAQASWLKLNEDFSVFERNAKAFSNWTEDDCSNYRDLLKVHDLGSRMKIIRDEIAKQSVSQ